MKFKLSYVILVLLAFTYTGVAQAATKENTGSSNLEWKIQKQWQLPESPLDIAHFP